MSSAMARRGVSACMPNLMGDALHLHRRISFGRAADGTALFVEEGKSILERRIARWQPSEFEIELSNGRLDHCPRARRVRAYCDKLSMQPGSGFANGFEGIHVMFLVRDSKDSFVALATAHSFGRHPQRFASRLPWVWFRL